MEAKSKITKFVAPLPAARPKSQCPPCKPCRFCKDTPFWLRSLKFGNKLFIAGSLVYYTGAYGAWGTPDESYHFVNHLYSHFRYMLPYHISAIFWPDN